MRSRALRKLLELPPRSWLTLLEVAAFSLAVEVGLQVVPFRRLLGWLQAQPARQRRVAVRERQMAELCRLAQAVFRRYPFNLTCLKRTLILLALLRRRGLSADLKIGVTKAGRTIHAHAWVEQEGEVFLDDAEFARGFEGVISLAQCP